MSRGADPTHEQPVVAPDGYRSDLVLEVAVVDGQLPVSLEVIAVAETAQDAIQVLAVHGWQLAVVDLFLGKSSGLEVVRHSGQEIRINMCSC